MNVSLTPELEEMVQKKVASGMYNSASEVVREGLRLLAEHDEIRKMRLGELRKKIDQGWTSAQRGDVTPGDEVFERIGKKIRERKR